MLRPTPRSTLFPYTTLFRSLRHLSVTAAVRNLALWTPYGGIDPELNEFGRSEEHTSELQSLTNLVCRLLLEKKNKNTSEELKAINPLIERIMIDCMSGTRRA